MRVRGAEVEAEPVGPVERDRRPLAHVHRLEVAEARRQQAACGGASGSGRASAARTRSSAPGRSGWPAARSAMSVYSRCVEARGTISIESTPAPSPRRRSRSSPRGCGSGASVGGPGWPLDRRAVLHEVRLDVEAVLGLHGRAPARPASRPGPGCRSMRPARAACRARRPSRPACRSPCTYDTAEAPSEWPMIATRRGAAARVRAAVARAVEQLPQRVEARSPARRRRCGSR